jgi:hypothetical protein
MLVVPQFENGFDFSTKITRGQSRRNKIAAKILLFLGFNVCVSVNIKDTKGCMGVKFTAGEVIINRK